MITVAFQKVLKSGSMSPLTLFFLFKIVLAPLGFLNFRMNFRTSLLISVKKPAVDFDRDYTASTYQLGQYRHLNNINSSNPYI